MPTVAKDQQVPQLPCYLESVIALKSRQSRDSGLPTLSLTALEAEMKKDS